MSACLSACLSAFYIVWQERRRIQVLKASPLAAFGPRFDLDPAATGAVLLASFPLPRYALARQDGPRRQCSRSLPAHTQALCRPLPQRAGGGRSRPGSGGGIGGGIGGLAGLRERRGRYAQGGQGRPSLGVVLSSGPQWQQR